MKKLLANLSLTQKITIGVVAVAIVAGIYGLIHYQTERDFKPLFTGVAPEDGAAIIQKLREAGVEYRLPEGGGSVLVPSARLAELRLNMAAAGLPKTGRIGFELFDKTNLGATEFTEHINYSRALEGELERSVMSIDAVEQARVHLTFSKDSVFLEAQQPAKASVLVKVRAGSHLSAQNVTAISHLVASAVEGLTPDAVSVLDMNGNLLSHPKAASIDGTESSQGALEYRHQVETDLIAKINGTLEPLLGANKFRAGVSVDCDFSGGEQSEELFDPARTVMASSQRTEDSSGGSSASGVPGTPSTLPRPTSRPASASNKVTRMTENIIYQASRTVKKMRLPAGTVKKMSLAILVDQDLTWEPDKAGFKRILAPPSPEKLKTIHDLVAGITGLNTERGDQLVVETLPFESTLSIEPPATIKPATPAKPQSPLMWPPNRNMMLIGGGVAVGLIVVGFLGAVLLRRRKSAATASANKELPSPGSAATDADAGEDSIDKQLATKLSQRDALQRQMDAKAINAITGAPVITKTSEIMAKHLREKIKAEPAVSAQVLRAWIQERDEA
jgi:flagellar M-ring protein FliF